MLTVAPLVSDIGLEEKTAGSGSFVANLRIKGY
jgi:hypothetical protein